MLRPVRNGTNFLNWQRVDVGPDQRYWSCSVGSVLYKQPCAANRVDGCRIEQADKIADTLLCLRFLPR